jgi:nucleotide-binding universal stress UspA family protein
MQIKNILVAVDGSETSEKALDFTLAIAEKLEATIKILNVSEALPMGAIPTETISLGTSIPVVTKDFRRIHEQILEKAVEHAKTVSPSVAVSSLLREGNAALEIVNVAKEGKFDVVVVGHKGAGKVKEFLMGSVSEKVSHLAPCPVIIVR